jgi:hypothetical protein
LGGWARESLVGGIVKEGLGSSVQGCFTKGGMAGEMAAILWFYAFTGRGCRRNGDRVIGRGTTARVGSRNSFLERLDHWTW